MPASMLALIQGNRLFAALNAARQHMRPWWPHKDDPLRREIQNVKTPDCLRAQRRALCLLLRLLNAEQRQEFNQHKYFHVTGARSNIHYRIRMDAVANIDVLDDNGKVDHQLCVYPAGEVPLFDAMASQLLQLQDPIAEVRLLEQANMIPPLPGSRLYCQLATLSF
jgi:hypothetical protein